MIKDNIYYVNGWVVHVIDGQGIKKTWTDEQGKPLKTTQVGNGQKWGESIPGRGNSLATGTGGKHCISGDSAVNSH